MSNLVKYYYALCFLAGSCMAQGGECPSGWAKWKDEKCYVLKTTYFNYASAKEICAGEGAQLANIKEEEQQTFLTNFIFNISEVKMGVWIGATRKPDSKTEFLWNDGSSLEYTNWVPDSPTPIIGRDCVALQSKFSTMDNTTDELLEPEDGKWKDVSCEIVNYFVCETVPSWSLDEIRRVLIDTRKALEATMEKLDNTVEALSNTNMELNSTITELSDEKRKVETLQKNPVPIGFIYIEYHGQPQPGALWPGVNWTDVTSTYAGLFFRALGGGSAAFGSTQPADSPRFSKAESQWSGGWMTGVIDIIPGSWSEWLHTGIMNGRDVRMRFYVSNAEVRPKNAAIRIWKRV